MGHVKNRETLATQRLGLRPEGTRRDEPSVILRPLSWSSLWQISPVLVGRLFREAGLSGTDPDYLIGEQVCDLKNYQAILSAIAGGARQPSEIGLQADMPHRSSADSYLVQLLEMDYIKRELPITIDPAKRATSRQSRYVIADNYLRFYFRSVRPNLSYLA